MENSWKGFFKENALLFVVFFVVVFGFLSITIYNGIRDARASKITYESGTYEEVPNVIKKYDVNEYKVITKSDQDLAEYYLRKLVKMWDNDPGLLYDLMSTSAKNSYSSREDCIKELTKKKSSRVRSSKVDYYSVNGGNIVIVTNENIQFKLNTKGINDFVIEYMGNA